MTAAPSSLVAAAGWTAIATLLRPQGRRGELLAEPLSDLPEIFAAGRSVALARAGDQPPADAPTRILEAHWFPTGRNAGRLVLQLSGCSSIAEAESLAGLQVLVPSAALPALDPDTFFVGDLVGCALFDGGRRVGTVVDLEFATAPDGRTRLEDAAPLLAIALDPPAHPETPGTAADPAPAPAEPILVPFVRAWLEAVDLPNRRILMHLPAGLLAP